MSWVRHTLIKERKKWSHLFWCQAAGIRAVDRTNAGECENNFHLTFTSLDVLLHYLASLVWDVTAVQAQNNSQINATLLLIICPQAFFFGQEQDHSQCEWKLKTFTLFWFSAFGRALVQTEGVVHAIRGQQISMYGYSGVYSFVFVGVEWYTGLCPQRQSLI